MEHPQDSQESEYLVLHQEQVQGPFGVDFIEAMILAGVYPPSVQIQKTGTSTWSPFSQIVPAPFGIPASGISPKPTGHIPVPAVSQPNHSTGSKKTKADAAGNLILRVFGVLAVLWIIGLVLSPKKASSPGAGTRNTPTSSRNTYAPPVVPAPLPPSVYSSSRSVFPADSSKIYSDASGRTYRVSHADNMRLLAMQVALNQKKMQMDLSKNETRSLGVKIDLDRTYLDRTNQYAVDSFNQNVNRFNAMNDTLKATVAGYNRDVDAYNAELSRVGTLIH